MNNNSPRPLPLAEIAERVGGSLEGPPDFLIRGVAEPAEAGPEDIIVLSNKSRLQAVEMSKAGAVVAGGPWEVGRPVVRVKDARLALAFLLEHFHPLQFPPTEIHEKAHIGRNVKLGRDVCLQPGVILDDDVHIGDRTVLYPNVFVGRGSRIGKETVIYANVSVYWGVEIGDRVIIHSGVVLGSDGFGFAQQEDGTHRKIPHVGRVVVEDDVEIGALTAVDRATMGETRIGRGTKIDNLVQVAHNVKIGEDCIVAGHAGIAGSSTLGRGVILAAGAGVSDHVKIGDRAILTARTGVHRDIEPGTSWAAASLARPSIEHMKLEIELGKVPDALKSIKKHAERLTAIEKRMEGKSE
jgi:UDP-3-O-[3-hydroxymyristoyl] glucosamine N-acyltransferase